MFASGFPIVNSVPCFGRKSSVGVGGPKWDADTPQGGRKGKEYFSAPSPILPSPAPQEIVHHYTPTPPQTQQYTPLTMRSPEPAQRAPASQGQQGSAFQPRQRKQFTPLPAPPSHIYRQLLVGNKIKPESPGPNCNPAAQSQNLHCKFHQGAPSHTLDNCWRLRERSKR
ncbi:hypothetical protein CRG98_031984 [Punica granatum]|uniref:Uncharacterized protein n=1 Tax=Punica granatum TaxID=22663 RepID=A0A2I0IV44_PUNGR|nr:hypothetical protein CRG98_031984 [Punica granatum]